MNDGASPLHRTLLRQLEKLGLTDTTALPSRERWESLLRRISNHYFEGEKRCYTLERSLELSSKEMGTRYDMLRDLSESRLEYLAFHDPLTALPNRFRFDELLAAALENQQQQVEQGLVALMVLDLDRFKNVNDTLGHQQGDQLLKKVAQRLSGALQVDEVLARLGGDDFLVLLPEAESLHVVEQKAEQLKRALQNPFVVGSRELYIGCSLGISIGPQDGQDVSTLFKNADSAMYQAKAAGGNRYEFYSETFANRTKERFELEGRLRHALDRKEFVLYYQPQLGADGGHVTGVEALIRWRSPEMGMVPPDKFIPLAEETGLIGAIGAWVLQEACHQGYAWQQLGLKPLRMAVNLSIQQFHTSDIVGQVRDALDQSGLHPSLLELELTESALASNPQQAMLLIQQLKQLGVQLAIDDFGTGYSSLSYLKNFAVDALKIDKSFIQGIPEDHNDELIARAVIALGHSFMLRVVAEGVETVEQLAFLRQQGCDELQGYHFSRPLPAEEIPDFLRALEGAGCGA
jgi:diguanylate cyclase (GGDEF)-like protein